MKSSRLALVLIGLCVLSATGCALIAPNSPYVKSQLQTISAGHTGCMPADNVISNQDMFAGTWNATCKATTYLCSPAGTESYSCAPVAQ
jgi:hypothetical protein